MSYPTQRLKHVASINDNKLSDDTRPDLDFRYVDIGAVGRGTLVSEPEHLSFASAPSRARRLVRPGDTIVSTVRTYLRAVWPVAGPTDDLVVSTGFAVVRPRTVTPRFAAWALQGDDFIEAVVARSVGVSYPAITPTELGEVHIPLPDPDTQQRISSFLDIETGRIDELIRMRHATANLLSERLRSSIDQLIVDRRNAPSALLARVARLHGGLTIDGANDGAVGATGHPYLRVANVQPGFLDLSEVKEVLLPPERAARYVLQVGDVLMTEGGDIDKLGRGTVWRGEIDGCLHQNHVFAVRPDTRLLLPAFLALFTQSSAARAYFESTGVQSTNLASTSASKVLALPVPVPSLDEQQVIVEEYERLQEEADRLAAVLNRQLALLHERRRALITSVVAGEMEAA